MELSKNEQTLSRLMKRQKPISKSLVNLPKVEKRDILFVASVHDFSKNESVKPFSSYKNEALFKQSPEPKVVLSHISSQPTSFLVKDEKQTKEIADQLFTDVINHKADPNPPYPFLL